MIITDYSISSIFQVFKIWNWNENSTYVPVRVFTYLIGKEAAKIDEDVQWIVRSCLNRGDYKHVQTQEEVREKVLEYIPVVARPLVLQSVVHPIVWTHTYADITVGIIILNAIYILCKWKIFKCIIIFLNCV